MKILKLFLASLLFSIILSACSKPTDGDTDGGNTGGGPIGTGNGVLKGVVYSPNGQVPLAAATIETTVNSEKKTFTSDKDGKFSLELPAGDYTVKIYTGAGDRLSLQKQFKVAAGKTTDIPAADTRLTFSGKIAYIKGFFDNIQELVKEMGIPATELTADQVLDYNNLKQYDILLMNCNSNYSDFEDIKTLDRFLKDGHTIYASDWEIYHLSEKFFGFIPESLLDFHQNTVSGEVAGTITYEPFKQALGKTTYTIEYDQSAYVQISRYPTNDSRFKVLVSNPQQGPLAMSIQWGPTHLSSKGIAYGGNIMYTTFHDAALSPDVKAVLRQMILQL